MNLFRLVSIGLGILGILAALGFLDDFLVNLVDQVLSEEKDNR